MKAIDLEIGKKYLILNESLGQNDYQEIQILNKVNSLIKCLFEDDNQKIWYEYKYFNDTFKIVECLSDDIDMLIIEKDQEQKTVQHETQTIKVSLTL
jgi:hypothetical protein